MTKNASQLILMKILTIKKSMIQLFPDKKGKILIVTLVPFCFI